ncbi:Right handed beta helix region [Saccharicrinis carchari]|uniref:Right handed beta helix region n=1 Tax=Saccharicrinis carchari TaxID=1168039 RepID=A0A521BXB3_SACCC|nr:right-handed parallel beta-helix repeat-containing protein [Saccharicrinis carchari]SMO51818.1 Right handed beta helix region [Saccharicrinis carchari]
MTHVRFILIQLIFLISVSGFSEELKLTDFGVKPWSFQNASPAIAKALESVRGRENVVLKFPGGRIDLWPEAAVKKELYISNTTENDTLSKVKNLGICIEDFSNITLEGNNTLVVLHGKMVSFAVLNSRNVTIRNIRFDYEHPTMAELKIVEVSNDRTKLETHPDTKFEVHDGQLLFYGEGWGTRPMHTVIVKPAEDKVFRSSWAPFAQFKATKESFNTIAFDGDVSEAGFETGDILTIRNPYRDNCGGFINLSQNVVLENVKMHYIHGMGIVSQFSENITFKKVEVAPREESGRTIAAFADCFHFSGCKGLIEVDSCRTSGSHDDPMNVHGTHLKITKIEEKQLTLRFMHHQTYGFKAFFAGDSVAFVRPENLLVYDFGIVKRAHLISKREMVLEMVDSLPTDLKEDDCLENITWTPEVIVRNNHFERTSTRGLLVTTRRRVLIENNTFYRTGMHGILITNDCNFWYESGPVRDLTIRGNRFAQCPFKQGDRGYVISIQPETHNFPKGKYIHSNIRIEDNVFECAGSAVLFARSVNHLKFKNNDVNLKPFNPSENATVATFDLEHCRDVEIDNNRFTGFEGEKLNVKYMSKTEIKTGRRVFKQGF